MSRLFRRPGQPNKASRFFRDSTIARVWSFEQRQDRNAAIAPRPIDLGHSLPFRTVRTAPLILVGFCLSWPRPRALRLAGVECITGKFLDRNASSPSQFECVDQPLNLPFLDPHVHGLPAHAAELGDRRGSAGQLDRRRDHVRSIGFFATRGS